MQSSKQPIVGVICDKEILGPHAFHVAGDKYLQAIASASHCLPILIPALVDQQQIEQILTVVDGILLTGGYSMVNPLHYQDLPASSDTKLDNDRDQTSLALVRAAINSATPLFGICRGFQEINVALGGSLHQYLYQSAQYIEHREDKTLSLAAQYGDSHNIQLTPHGKLSTLLATQEISVNSLHTQGVDRLAEGLLVEAVAEDGLVEAFSVEGAQAFAMAVQWHPEWQVQNNKNSLKLFHAFGQACAIKQSARQNHG